MYYLNRGGGQFQNLPLGFSHYNHSYPSGQESKLGVLQTVQQVHVIVHLGPGAMTIGDPWVQWTPYELDLCQDTFMHGHHMSVF